MAGCAGGESATGGAEADAGETALGVAGRTHDDGDEVVTLAECPPAVQATIRAHLDGGTITEIERTTDHGEVLYEIDVAVGDDVVEFDIAEDGSFRGYESDDDDDDDDHDGPDDD
jgi:hypothetical protein